MLRGIKRVWQSFFSIFTTNQKLKVMFTNAIAVTNEKDIMSIHGVVSNELKAHIEEAYPHLFRKQFNFTKLDTVIGTHGLNLPFSVGKGLVGEDDKYTSLVIHPGFELEVYENEMGVRVMRFFGK